MAAFAVLVAAVLCGVANAHFRCTNVSAYNDSNTLLDLKPLLSLESIAFDFCKQSNCTDADVLPAGLGGLVGKVGGAVAELADDLLRGPLQCLLDPNGDHSNPNKVTPYQTCVFASILSLNVLDTCDVQLIVSTLSKICPCADLHKLAISACLCCGKPDERLEVCVNLALGSKGLQLDIQPADVPIIGDLLGGKEGTNILKIGEQSKSKSKSKSKESGLGELLGDDGIQLGGIQLLGSASRSKEKGGKGSGLPSLPIGGLPIGNLPLGNLPLGNLPLGK